MRAITSGLIAATLCLEPGCNTVFDQSAAERCPTCGSTASYPVVARLNRGRDGTARWFVRVPAC